MTDNREAGDVMAQAAEKAVTHAAQYHQVKLDYSVESLPTLEKVLDSLASSIPKGWFKRKVLRHGPSERQLLSMALLYGAYLGEVFRRKKGGFWKKSSQLNRGTDLPTLDIDGVEIFPTNKVFKRLLDGAEHNVAFYFNAFDDAKDSGRP